MTSYGNGNGGGQSSQGIVTQWAGVWLEMENQLLFIVTPRHKAASNRMVDRTGRDAAQYFNNLWAVIRSPLR